MDDNNIEPKIRKRAIMLKEMIIKNFKLEFTNENERINEMYIFLN